MGDWQNLSGFKEEHEKADEKEEEMAEVEEEKEKDGLMTRWWWYIKRATAVRIKIPKIGTQ